MKLFRYIVPIVFLLLSFVGTAQTEYTRYYDANWKTTTKDKASYIRKITYGKDGKPQGLVHDYFYDKWKDSIQGLQWEGYILSENLETGEDVCDGKCVWYNENGGIVQIATYKNGVLDGLFWRKRDWGVGETKLGIFKDGKIDGWFFEYRSDKVYVYKDGNDLSHRYFYRRTQKNPCWDNDGDSVKIIPSERKKIYYNRSTPNVIQSYTVYWDTSYNKPQFKSQNYVWGEKYTYYDKDGYAKRVECKFQDGIHTSEFCHYKIGNYYKNGKKVSDSSLEEKQDRYKQWIRSAIYDSIVFSDENLLWVQKNGKVGAVSHSTGKIIIEPKYSVPRLNGKSCQSVFTNLDVGVVSQNNKFGLITPMGDAYTKCIFDELTLLDTYDKKMVTSPIVAAARIDSLWGAVNQYGKFVIAPQYSEMQPFVSQVKQNGVEKCLFYFAVKHNGKWGIVSAQNKVVVPFVFDQISVKCCYDEFPSYIFSVVYFVKNLKAYAVDALVLENKNFIENLETYRMGRNSNVTNGIYPSRYMYSRQSDFCQKKYCLEFEFDKNDNLLYSPNCSMKGRITSDNVEKRIDAYGNSVYIDGKDCETVLYSLPTGFELLTWQGNQGVALTNKNKREDIFRNFRFSVNENEYQKVGVYDMKKKQFLIDTLYDIIYEPNATDSLFWVRIQPDKEQFANYKNSHLGVEGEFYYQGWLENDWQLLSYTGKKVTEQTFQFPHQVNGTLAKIGISGSYGVMNQEGKIILPQKYEKIFFQNYGLILFGSQKFGLANRNGEILVENRWTSVSQYLGNHFVAFSEKAIDLVDTTGKIVKTINIKMLTNPKIDLSQYLECPKSLCDLSPLSPEIRNIVLLNYARQNLSTFKYYQDNQWYNKDIIELLAHVQCDSDFLPSHPDVELEPKYPWIEIIRQSPTVFQMKIDDVSNDSLKRWNNKTYNYVFEDNSSRLVELKDLFKKDSGYEAVLNAIIQKRMEESILDRDSQGLYRSYFVHGEYVEIRIPDFHFMDLVSEFVICPYGIEFYAKNDNNVVIVPYFEIENYLDYSGPLKYFLEE
ncbi:MAG: WG repeat-containing protein [Bacteroidales bacterium]|nr:WG repeat-containing protein [Bacteroidales bacterium]